MSDTSFDLIDILKTVQKQKRTIIVITIIAVILGGLFFAIKKKKYKSECQFFVNNPLYGDRSTLFRSEMRYVDFFAGDDDLDKVSAFANSDTVKDKIIRNCDFDKIYPYGDINEPKAHAMYMSIFDKNFNLKRTEYKNMEITYIAYDPVTAANVVNMAEKVIEESYRDYYNSMKNNIYSSIEDKVNQLDTVIDSLTDTLGKMREQYGIYNMVSPARQNIILNDMKATGKGYGLGLEKIQNIESIKDQYVIDRIHYNSVLNEFSATVNPKMDFFRVITRGLAPTAPTGLDIIKTLFISALLGLFFSVMYVCIVAYFRKLNAVVR